MFQLRVLVVSDHTCTLGAVLSPASVGDFRMVSSPVNEVVTR